MKILVTGGAGFIGSNLVGELRNRGHDAWACDLLNSHLDKYYRADVSEYRQVERICENHKFDYVYHLAAEYGRWNGEDFYETLWKTNVIGTKNVIRLQEKHKFRMIAFSSSEVYGDYEGIMYEDVMDKVPIKQMNDYAMTKWVNEIQCINSNAMFGTETVRVRPENVYGPHEHYSPYRGVVPRFIYCALRKQPYTVYTKHKRIFEYVGDFVKATANIADNFKAGEVYNLGGNREVTIKELSDIVLSYLKMDDSLVTYEDFEPFTTKKKTYDTSKAARDLKHNPTTTIEEGVAKTVEWMKSYYGL
jgi:dTDP-glucose 4,6-dehydratase